MVIAFTSHANSSEENQWFEESKDEISLFTGNYACGVYGKYTSELDAPMFPQKHFDISKRYLEIAVAKIKDKEKAKKMASKIYNGLEKNTLEKYKSFGPDGLKEYVIQAMNDKVYTYPKWINNCRDLYTYSQTILETSI